MATNQCAVIINLPVSLVQTKTSVLSLLGGLFPLIQSLYATCLLVCCLLRKKLVNSCIFLKFKLHTCTCMYYVQDNINTVVLSKFCRNELSTWNIRK